MGFWRQFDIFDPKNGIVPPYPFYQLQDIAWRARRLLWKRTSSEITYAAQTIDWMIESFFESERENFIEDQIQNNGWAKSYILQAIESGEHMDRFLKEELPGYAGSDDYLDYSDEDSTSEVEALKGAIDLYDISDKEFKNAEQYEYFAVLALWLVSDSIEWFGRDYGSSRLALAAESSIKAMDAVCHAELLQSVDKYKNRLNETNKEINKLAEQKATERRSENARKAAVKRHEETKALKQDALNYYVEHEDEFSSIEDAASKIAGKIVPLKHRTVAGYISEFKKLQSARKL